MSEDGGSGGVDGIGEEMVDFKLLLCGGFVAADAADAAFNLFDFLLNNGIFSIVFFKL